MMTFRDYTLNYQPCTRCKQRMVNLCDETTFCFLCIDDMKVTKFLAPFPPEGQQLDEHLFPVEAKVLELTN